MHATIEMLEILLYFVAGVVALLVGLMIIITIVRLLTMFFRWFFN